MHAVSLQRNRKNADFSVPESESPCKKRITDYSKGPFPNAGLHEFIFLQILIVPAGWGGLPIVLSTILITASGFTREQ